jgi:nucleotide-binding universal stress UspA family protein
MGYTVKSRMNRFILGSITNKIIERSPCPVLVIPHNASFHGIKNMVYAAMLTETEIWKINQLTALAKAFDSDVHIIHITSKGEDKIKFGLKEFKTETKKSVQYEKLVFKSIPAENTVDGIQNYIHENNIDIISMSTRTRMGLQKLFETSITEKVTSHIDIPLLVFHYEKNE